MKPACETASFHKSWRPVVATLYLLRSPVKIAENSCGNNCWIQPTNIFNQKKFYRRCSTKGTKQCNFIKCLSILIARKHKKICPFIEKWVDCNCLLVYNRYMLCCDIMISVTFLDVTEVFSLIKVKLNFKICTRRKPLLIFLLKADWSNKNYEKKLEKYM